jgi:hypothetical protein
VDGNPLWESLGAPQGGAGEAGFRLPGGEGEVLRPEVRRETGLA